MVNRKSLLIVVRRDGFRFGGKDLWTQTLCSQASVLSQTSAPTTGQPGLQPLHHTVKGKKIRMSPTSNSDVDDDGVVQTMCTQQCSQIASEATRNVQMRTFLGGSPATLKM